MPTPAINAQLRNAEFGFLVSRATATLPAGVKGSIFTVTGRIKVNLLVGEVTTVLGATVTSLVIGNTPTVGSAVANSLATTAGINRAGAGAHRTASARGAPGRPRRPGPGRPGGAEGGGGAGPSGFDAARELARVFGSR